MTSRQQENEGTGAVRPGLEIDVAALDRYMSAHIDDYQGPLTIEQFKGGQSNPTYKLTTPGHAYVLRRKPPGKLLKSAHAVDREFKLLAALYPAGVPVARPYVLEEDDSIIGTAFYIMEFVGGRIYWEAALPGLAPAERTAIYDAMNDSIARLHRVDYQAVGLGDYGRPKDYIRRQVARWSDQYQASKTEEIPAMDNLMAWLPDHIPAAEDVSVVHGDYRVDNLIFHPTEQRVAAILDWELSTIGHPLADFSYATMLWRLPPDVFNGIRGLDLQALGIPSEEDYVAAYCRRTDRDGIPDWDVYMIYNIFRLAGIMQGIMGRVVAGTASSAHAVANGKLAKPLAEIAWAEVERLGLV
ncbi:phosphotransferase family protein [Govanella unica]|uniref:Phosphotransferase family protein n=1 Tax=Govanella unica TaxID=2975056 RepID=A0A9X3TX56_9PROT|nr:phosphotransferase family protein [Govania unica]MDA5193334.1 phosphotransferase family protein [Govania unica]